MSSQTIYLLNSNCGDASIDLSKTVLCTTRSARGPVYERGRECWILKQCEAIICILWCFWELILTWMVESLLVDNSKKENVRKFWENSEKCVCWYAIPAQSCQYSVTAVGKDLLPDSSDIINKASYQVPRLTVIRTSSGNARKGTKLAR